MNVKICPVCRSANIHEGNDGVTMPDHVSMDWECSDCESTWYIDYSPVDVNNIRRGPVDAPV